MGARTIPGSAVLLAGLETAAVSIEDPLAATPLGTDSFYIFPDGALGARLMAAFPQGSGISRSNATFDLALPMHHGTLTYPYCEAPADEVSQVPQRQLWSWMRGVDPLPSPGLVLLDVNAIVAETLTNVERLGLASATDIANGFEKLAGQIAAVGEAER